ncbi:hypothetical protein RQP46_010142 [Phenoliferia psychrophenolica]
MGRDEFYDAVRAGLPIGLLDARGTPFEKKPIYTSRKCKLLCPILGLVTMAITLVITLFPVLRAVAIHTLHTSVLHISSSNITSPTNGTFTLTLEGQAAKVGVFPAQLHFKRPIEVYWIAPEDLETELLLGRFSLEPIGVAAGHGRIKQLTEFYILDLHGFGRFAQFLITQESFTWRLKSDQVQAKAFSFIAVNGMDFVKDITLPGMANFTDVSVSDFQAVTTVLTNPSAFGIEIGTLEVSLWYQGLPAQTAHALNLTTGTNHIDLIGRLIEQTDEASLAKLSTLFSLYLNGETLPVEARGISVSLANGEVVAWLQTGIEALVLDVALTSPTGRISPIQSITIEALSLAFDTSTPYAPTANSSQVSAMFGLPFGFSLDIIELQNSLNIVVNRTIVAGIDAPLGMSNTTLLTRNAGYTEGSISLDLPESSLVIGDLYTDHLAFDQFTYDLTTTNGSTFYLLGSTEAVTDTPVGQVKLTDIAFTVPAGLIGLQGLKEYPTLLLTVDVVGGTADAISLNISVGLTNPSNLDIILGDVTFQLFNGPSFLGTAALPGYQVHEAPSSFQANANAGALATLNDYANGLVPQVNGSSSVESLTQALMGVHLNATLNGLATKLLNYANLTVLTTTGVTDNIASSTVSLQNPFTAALRITNINSTITHASGLYVGSIMTATDFTAPGKEAYSTLNLYPPSIFTLARVLAVDAGLSTEQLDGIVELGGYSYLATVSTTSKRSLIECSTSDCERDALTSGRRLARRNIYTGFNLPSYILSAFANLYINVELVVALHIGDFVTDLTYAQSSLRAYTDSTLTVQKVIDSAILNITTVIISDPENDSFVATLTGEITNAGPFDAVISFPVGLTVAWNGSPLGQLSMPDVTVVGDEGATLNLQATFAVSDVSQLTAFTEYLLNEPSFVWQNGVTIDSFDLPSDDSAGGVTLTIQSTLVNPSAVGVVLSTLGFQAQYGSTTIGPVAATRFTLAPKATMSLPLTGRLVAQDSATGLADVSTIFNAFIHGVPVDLVVRGDYAGPSDVTWLNTGIQALAIAVILPGENLDIINSITLNELALQFTEDDPWAPSFSTENTVAAFQLPFAFPVTSFPHDDNITLGIASDIAFNLVFMEEVIGTAVISNLTLVPGNNPVATAVHFAPSGSAETAAGQVLLENYIQNLVQEAGVAEATITLGNPFTAQIEIIDVLANATYNSLYLGQVNQQSLSPPISAPGHTAVVSNTLPFALNVDPKVLIRFVEEATTAQGVDLGVLLPEFAYVLGLSSTASSVTTSVNTGTETCAPTGAETISSNLETNLSIEATVLLDDYRTALSFQQLDVTTVLDDSVLYLTGIIGKTIVSHIVDGAVLASTGGNVTNLTDTGFTVSLAGSLTDAFPDGLDVIWEGHEIATISLPAICSSADTGVPALSTTAILTITDESRFEDFASFILLPGNTEFTWTVATDTLRVAALQTFFDNVSLSKNVTFLTFDGLPGDFPGDASGGIELSVDTLIPSPSNLGIELGHTSFIASFEGEEVGPIDTYGLSLAPLATTTAHFNGTIIHRSDAAGLASLGVLFSQFLAGENSTLQVTGVEVISPAQPDSPVKWLTSAFEKLTLNVTLPGQSYTIIFGIQLQDLTVHLTEASEAYALPFQNNETIATFANPFGFSLTPLAVGGAFIIEYNSVDDALLTLPVADVVSAETSTGNNASLVIDFLDEVPLVSLNDPGYDDFLAAITTESVVNFRIHGSANVSAETKAGDVLITGIPFDVATTFTGIDGFGGVAAIPSTPLVIGSGAGDEFAPTEGSQFIRITLSVILSNPAPLILYTNDVSFAVLYDNYTVGRAYITPLNLYPGTNTIDAEFHYEPADSSNAVALNLLTEYLETTGQIDLTVQGDTSSTPYESLQEGLSEIKLATS